jgi:Mrp family chromosome partitioning ATPase/predicted Fe-Mo cluster-binding NifX family protein
MSDHSENGSCQHGGCSDDHNNRAQHDQEFKEQQEISSRMGRIGHKIVVLSGKGGVGKSTVSVNLAVALAMAGKKVGILDVDIHGPNVPKMLHVEGAQLQGTDDGLLPVFVEENLWAMSVGFLIQKRDDAVIWRGPRKYSLIKQFLKDVVWGDLDYLIVDCPPGTGDEPLAVVQLIENADGAIIVATPQQVAIQDVRRSIKFAEQLSVPVLGVVENMSGFVCPHCNERVEIFGSGGGEAMALELGVRFLGAIPLDPSVVTSGDSGQPVVRSHPHSETAKGFGRIVRSLLESELVSARPGAVPADGRKKIAIPVVNDLLCMHFGHCEHFAIFDVDAEKKEVLGKRMVTPPPHEPGVLPRWLHAQGANLIISGGMGSRAQSLFNQNGVQVVTGASPDKPEKVVKAYLDGTLVTGSNVCDH